MEIKIQQSKDTFCDYLLIKLWQSFLLTQIWELDSSGRGERLINHTKVVQDFMKHLESIDSKTTTDLAQFGIKNSTMMTRYLKQAYANLLSNHVDF